MMLAFGLAHNSLAATNVNVTVNWNKYPVKADNFWKNYVNLLASKEIVGIVDKTNLITALNSSIEDVYTVGKIKGGQYAGNFVYVLGFRKQFGSYLFLVMRDKEKFYIIKSYDKEDFYSVLGVYYATQPDAQLIKKAFIVKHNIKLSNYFDHTEKIIVGKFELNKWVVNFIVEPKMDTAKVVKTYNNGNKLKQRADGYYMVDKAGVAYNYVYKLPSQITFSGKTRQKFDYLTPISGCGGNGSVFGTMGISAFSKKEITSVDAREISAPCPTIAIGRFDCAIASIAFLI